MIWMHLWHKLPNLHLSILHFKPAHDAQLGFCKFEETQNAVTAASSILLFGIRKIVEFTIFRSSLKRFYKWHWYQILHKYIHFVLSHAFIVNADCIKEIGNRYNTSAYEVLSKLTPKFVCYKRLLTFTIFGS